MSNPDQTPSEEILSKIRSNVVSPPKRVVYQPKTEEELIQILRENDELRAEQHHLKGRIWNLQVLLYLIIFAVIVFLVKK